MPLKKRRSSPEDCAATERAALQRSPEKEGRTAHPAAPLCRTGQSNGACLFQLPAQPRRKLFSLLSLHSGPAAAPSRPRPDRPRPAPSGGHSMEIR